MKRHTFNTNFSLDITSKLTFAASVNYIAQKRNSENNDGYSNQSSGSFNQWFHRDVDMAKMKELRNLKSPEGIYASWNKANPGLHTIRQIQKLVLTELIIWFNPLHLFRFN
jgi:hypothetical protein